MSEKLRIGISMRSIVQESYAEKRDVIAEDWSKFLLKEFPDATWMYLPNIGDDIVNFIKKWELNAFVLTGGEDVGTSEVRDITERKIIDYAIEHEYPIIGICRGLQLMVQYYGGHVEKEGEEFAKKHVATSHKITYGLEPITVNSYHHNKIQDTTLPSFFKVDARCVDDNSIEAISGKNMLGIMWHPERKLNYNEQINELLRNFFLKQNIQNE